MKNFTFTFLFAFILFFSCENNTQEETNQNDSAKTSFIDIDVKQFDEMRVNKEVVVLDVRTPEETDQGIVDGAIKIDVRDANFEKNIQALDKNKTYLVYCKSGGRSVKACNKMLNHEFKNLYNLKGGYTAWAKTNN